MSKFTTAARPHLIALPLLLASACATGPSQLGPECDSLSCFEKNAKAELYKRCIAHLSQYPSRRSGQEAIDREFRYPLTSAESYYTWVRMGGVGPSPERWCRSYAHQKYHNPMGWSLNAPR